MTNIEHLGRQLGLGALLTELHRSFGTVEHIDHWKQGEFHHDIVLRVPRTGSIPALFYCRTHGASFAPNIVNDR